MNARRVSLRSLSVAAALVGYGGLAAFLWLVSMQIYRWFKDGEWTHVGMIDGLRASVSHCCAPAAGSALADFSTWLDTPASWLGLHRVFEVLPASLVLFAISIVGNCAFIYCRDRLEDR
jgi:hypothetical protein